MDSRVLATWRARASIAKVARVLRREVNGQSGDHRSMIRLAANRLKQPDNKIAADPDYGSSLRLAESVV